jgi:hypothetical protein
MEIGLQALAQLAPSLSSAELRVLIQLAATAEAEQSDQTRASSRELAKQTNLSRSNVQKALHCLNRRNTIATCDGGRKRAAGHILRPLPEVPEVRGPVSGPQADLFQGQGGIKTGPQVDLFQGQGGPLLEPLNNKEHTPARASRNIDLRFDYDRSIARLREAKKADYDEPTFEAARQAIESYAAKFPPAQRNPHPPDDAIVAQFLAVEEWPRLNGMLSDLANDRKQAGERWSWFVVVAIQRMHGLGPKEMAKAKLDIWPSRKPATAATAAAQPPPTPSEFGKRIAAMAAGKAMR